MKDTLINIKIFLKTQKSVIYGSKEQRKFYKEILDAKEELRII
jgi:hypothetical protein